MIDKSGCMRILFVCKGNICRSPMAEFIFKDIAKKNNMDSKFLISSVATTSEQLGNDIEIRTKMVLDEYGVAYESRRAKKITHLDYMKFDYIIAMDKYIVDDVVKIVKNDYAKKIYKLLDFTDEPSDIVDPYYTNDFETTYRDIYKGCCALFNYLVEQRLVALC